MKRMKKHEQPMPDEAAQEELEETPVTGPEETEIDEVAVETEAIDLDALKAAAGKAEEYLAMAQRVQADFDNFRRRNESVRADAYSEGQRSVATVFLPVLDNLERALAVQSAEGDALRTGVEMTLKQMNDVYEKLGVTPIDRLGEPFDPNLENAVMQGAPEDGEPGTVCAVLQKGYMMGKTVIRHAMVKVVPD
ncbi:MAG: nucleotide exchange factor GrpE [Christensenellaceae bacterium]|nr:nucleotide exchange factor GrpE [Christensenellaceae bacterium]